MYYLSINFSNNLENTLHTLNNYITKEIKKSIKFFIASKMAIIQLFINSR